MLHMQHHFLCNISYVVIAESMGESLKYTTNVHVCTCKIHCAVVLYYVVC